MLLLRLAAQDLLTLNSRRRMVPHLAARWQHFRGADASLSERSAWAESLVHLAEDIVAAGRGNVEMIVECAATLDEADRPGDPRLIDVVLVGHHPEESRLSVLLVELKRWSMVTRVERATAELVHVPGLGRKKHPALQLREYYEAFTGDRGPLHGLDFECSGFAYLHNATDASVRPLVDLDAPTGAYARVYTNDRREQLMSDLRKHFAGEGHTVKYASGSRAFNGAIQEHVGYGDREFKETFTYFSNFVTPPTPPLDVLICDEAHRLRARSTNRFWKPEHQGTKPQVDELLDASRLTVFFLDGGQCVRPHEVGTIDLIEDAARRYDASLLRYELREQFRCGGSDAYIRWVRAVLGVKGGEPEQWTPDGLMHVEVADSPDELERIIRTEALAGASARIVAGYCWPWTKPLGKERRLENDVRIGDWHKPWNADSDAFCENGAPPSKIWSVHEKGLDQIGRVYTAQGLEWDWCGVILGEDMVRRDGRWVFQRGKDRKDPETGVKRVTVPGSFDPKVRADSVDDEEFARLVRHAYHVLMTRASRATVLYSTDEETRSYLKDLVGEVQVHGLRPTWENLPEEARVPHLPRPRRGRRSRRKRQVSSQQSPDLRLF
ncbi:MULTISPECIES: DUF2075 domain-containing protein [unclassified Streptomyces]|uniref:DUF2075 domain-containing protein n=1 Tax=unclassified Streptomyces TaxID=2593676 RepID=UPI00093E44DE|nr:DUF2075 domain-containing protein [Streptomyces sp. TSRI0107]OKJ73699.1 AAA family ATPase [Streptomyces sp. TSRI0107]